MAAQHLLWRRVLQLTRQVGCKALPLPLICVKEKSDTVAKTATA
jgi:hypothetical protein